MMAQQNDYEYTPEDEYDEGEQNGQSKQKEVKIEEKSPKMEEKSQNS